MEIVGLNNITNKFNKAVYLREHTALLIVLRSTIQILEQNY